MSQKSSQNFSKEKKKTLVEKKNSSRDHFVINIANVVVCSPIFLSTNVGSISRLALDWEKSIFSKNCELLNLLCHSMFLKWWNNTKSIAKICKTFKLHDGFLSKLQERTLTIGLTTKNHHGNQIYFVIFAIPPHQVNIDKVVKYCQILERLFVVFHHSKNIL